MTAEVEASAGPKGQQQGDPETVRHGTKHWLVILGDQSVPLTWLWARTACGRLEIPRSPYSQFQDPTRVA